MTDLILFARLLISRPVWAWHTIWFSRFNPANLGDRHTKHFAEYATYELPVIEVLKRTSRSSDKELDEVLQEAKQEHQNKESGNCVIPSCYDSTKELARLCYALVRLTRPRIVVETGVGRGLSSSYILSALEKNCQGHLYSIELPMLRKGAQQDVGKLVPSSLKSRWTLIFGPGVHEMKRLRNKLESIDMFVHDSNHTYLNQRAEYGIALDWLRKDGILVSDDVQNDAFLEARMHCICDLMVAKQSKMGYVGIIVNGKPSKYIMCAREA